MRIAQINLPILDNDGNSLLDLHETIQRDLCNIFGGYTVFEARGGWLAPSTEQELGKLYQETVMVYQIAYNPADGAQHTIRAYAERYGKAAKQLAVFIVIDGEVEIIDL